MSRETTEPCDPPRVLPGNYTALYVSHKGMTVFRTPKVCVYFRLLEHPEIVLRRWYRVSDHRDGRVRAPGSSDIVREISAVLGQRVRADRIPVASLAGVMVRIEVKTVTADGKQRALAAVNQYSCIERVLAAQP